MRQVLSAKSTRRWARITGLPIQRMLARGGSDHWIMFRTTDDRHGWVRKAATRDEKAAGLEYLLSWDTRPDQHWSSCPGHADYDGMEAP